MKIKFIEEKRIKYSGHYDALVVNYNASGQHCRGHERTKTRNYMADIVLCGIT